MRFGDFKDARRRYAGSLEIEYTTIARIYTNIQAETSQNTQKYKRKRHSEDEDIAREAVRRVS